MTLALAVFTAIVLVGAIMQNRVSAEIGTQNVHLWQHVYELEADKRALTESLCRAEGKPFVQPRNGEPVMVSPGWFDAPPEVKVVEKTS